MLYKKLLRLILYCLVALVLSWLIVTQLAFYGFIPWRIQGGDSAFLFSLSKILPLLLGVIFGSLYYLVRRFHEGVNQFNSQEQLTETKQKTRTVNTIAFGSLIALYFIAPPLFSLVYIPIALIVVLFVAIYGYKKNTLANYGKLAALDLLFVLILLLLVVTTSFFIYSKNYKTAVPISLQPKSVDLYYAFQEPQKYNGQYIQTETGDLYKIGNNYGYATMALASNRQAEFIWIEPEVVVTPKSNNGRNGLAENCPKVILNNVEDISNKVFEKDYVNNEYIKRNITEEFTVLKNKYAIQETVEANVCWYKTSGIFETGGSYGPDGKFVHHLKVK